MYFSRRGIDPATIPQQLHQAIEALVEDYKPAGSPRIPEAYTAFTRKHPSFDAYALLLLQLSHVPDHGQLLPDIWAYRAREMPLVDTILTAMADKARAKKSESEVKFLLDFLDGSPRPCDQKLRSELITAQAKWTAPKKVTPQLGFSFA